MSMPCLPFVLAASLAVFQAEPGDPGISSPAATAAPTSARARDLLESGDLRANRGQWPSEVLFFGTTGSVGATLLEDALVFQSLVRERGEPLPPPFALRLPGKPRAVEGVGVSPTLYHYLLASGSASGVRGYERVIYRDVQPGIDVQVRPDGATFAYDLLVEPGADLESLVLELEGVGSPRLEGGAELVMEVGGEPVVQRIGECWQVDEKTGAREPVACRFRLIDAPAGGTAVGFEVPARDPNRSLVIDPSLLYATYLGGPHQELLVGFAVDASGANYLLADLTADAPTTLGSYQPSPLWIGAAYIAKISADGSTLEWATYLGGSDDAIRGADVAVDTDGSVVVVGTTWASDFPTTPGALQLTTNSPGLAEIFVSRLDPTGSSLVWSTLFGGSGQDQGHAVALFPSGDVLVATEPWSADVFATPGAFDTVKDPNDKMVLRISADGSKLVFGTFFRASRILDVAVDPKSNVYLGGDSLKDAPVPTTPGAFQEAMEPSDNLSGFLAKLDPLGTQVIWCTYLGGNAGFDTVWGIAVDAASAVYAAGQVDSSDFPTTPGAFRTDPFPSGDGGGFAAKLLPDGSGLVWSTFIGGYGGGTDYIRDVAVDAAGNLHTTGSASEPGWPTTPDAFDPFSSGSNSDLFLTKFDAFGEKLVYSTMFGGNSTDYHARIDLDGAGNPHIAGTGGTNVPVTKGAAQTTYGGTGDFLLAAFDVPLLRWRVLGNGLQGSKAPNLAGAGTLLPGSTTRLAVRGAVPNAPAWFVAGLAEVQLPFFGGVLHPSPDVVVPVSLDQSGALDFTFPWPQNSAVDLWFQLFELDPGAPFLLSATNALRAAGSG